MATEKKGGTNEFAEFLRNAPRLDESASEDVTELTGAVSQTEEGRFALTTGDGQTYELPVDAVRRFRAMEGPGFTSIATIQVTAEAIKNAIIRPIKPMFKEMIKDPIKDLIQDQKVPIKDLVKDPIGDKHLITDPRTDKGPPIDTRFVKDVRTDPALDAKWLHKDPIVDNVNKLPISDLNTGPGDVQDIPDPTGGLVNPAAGLGQGMVPFAIQTQHHAPQHLLNQQMGGISPAGLGGATYKPMPWEKHFWTDQTFKEMIRDTRKEMIRDTFKEMVFDPPNTWVEGIPDPTGGFGQPDPWGGAGGFSPGGFSQGLGM